MESYEKALILMDELFGKDCIFALATIREGKPEVRNVDAYYTDGAFWVVTYAASRKAKAVEASHDIEMCRDSFSFTGKAVNAGHPLNEENAEIRKKLIKAFEPWYFKHNDENDTGMCYLKIIPERGFIYGGGMGYKIDFINKTAVEFPFVYDIVTPA